MKTLFCTVFCLAGVASCARTDTTINVVNRSAYGGNIGWLDWRADGANGAVIGEFVCSGYIYAANVGWIHLGDGTPANGIRYQNNSATDCGVNHEGPGNLRGYAWGANIGWVNFEDQGAPSVDLLTGVLSGYIYSANAGWICLNNPLADGTRVFVQTGPLACPDSDGDGIADGYEFQWAGDLLVMDATTDYDGDGASDRNEFIADTNPNDPNEFLRFVSHAYDSDFESVTLQFATTRPTRLYRIQGSTTLQAIGAGAWADVGGLGLFAPDPGTMTEKTIALPPGNSRHFLRVVAVKPLQACDP